MNTGARSNGKVDRAAVAELLRQGLPGIQIAARLGCAANTVSQIKRELGIATEPRKPSSEWKARGRPRVVTKAKIGPAPTKYATERTHLALQLAEWPAGIRFEDAAVPREPMFRGTPPAFGFSVTGNGTAMCAAKLGFI